MSEESLRAMMELFALIVKQDGGMLQSEMNYVSDFLNKQLPYHSAIALTINHRADLPA